MSFVLKAASDKTACLNKFSSAGSRRSIESPDHTVAIVLVFTWDIW